MQDSLRGSQEPSLNDWLHGGQTSAVRISVGKFREDYAPMIEALPIADKARLAAFIDGEGTIYINVSSRLRGRAKSPQYNLSVTITGTTPIFMNWLKQTFDGSLYFVKYEKSKHLGKRQIIRWQVNGRMANTVLSNVVQYMIIKRPQAEVGLAFLNLMKPKMGGYKRQPALTEADIALRHGMKLEIERLNKSDGITMVQ